MKTFEITSDKLGTIKGEISRASGYGHYTVVAHDEEGNTYERVITDSSIYDDIDDYDNEKKQEEAERVLRCKLASDTIGWNYGE